jgi:hypothetical protein
VINENVRAALMKRVEAKPSPPGESSGFAVFIVLGGLFVFWGIPILQGKKPAH